MGDQAQHDPASFLGGHAVIGQVSHAPVHTADLGSFTAAFVTNSHGIAPVGQIDDLILPVDSTLTRMLTEAYESTGWDPI